MSWLPLVLSKNGFGLFSFSLTPGWVYALEVLGSFSGPTLAALLVTAALAGKRGIGDLLRRYMQRHGSTRWLLLKGAKAR